MLLSYFRNNFVISQPDLLFLKDKSIIQKIDETPKTLKNALIIYNKSFKITRTRLKRKEVKK